MKNLVLISLVMGVILSASLSFGQSTEPIGGSESGWKTEFETALRDGQLQLKRKNIGLGYTPTEEELFMDEEIILSKAMGKALENEAPPCECMKIAITEYDYNPYSVMKAIYANAGELDLDQLCMCATEKGVGISSQVVKKAAADAIGPTGAPRFTQDEITQSQCLNQDVGLAFTLAQEDLTEEVDPPDRPIDPVSPSVP